MSVTGDYNIKYIEDDDSFDIVTDMNGNFQAVSAELDDINDSLGGKAAVSHKHGVNDITGVLPVSKGGTGYTSVDTVPTSGSKRAVTSGGVYTALRKKQAKFCYLVAVNSYADDCDDTYINAADHVFDCSSGYASVSGLNSFLASLPAGSKVIFAPGSYLISDTIQVDTRLYLEGLNHRATFFTTADVPMLNIGNGTSQANNVTVRNLYFRKWDCVTMPPTEGTKSDNVYTTPIITVTNGNGVYIEKCGFYNHSPSYVSSKGYNSLIKYNGYASNSIVEKCVLNTTVHSLTNNGTVVGFTIDMSGCNGSNISLKFIANFGSITCFKPKAISSCETTFTGCIGVKEYNEDNIAVNALSEEGITNDSTDI